MVGGSAFAPAALHWNPRRQSREFARELRCMDERSDKLVRCLRLKDWRLLVSASRLSHNFESNTFRHWFRPVLDRNSTYSLLRDHPARLYQAGQFLRVPLLAGVSAHEGSLEYFINWHQLRPLSSLERLRFLIRPYLYEFSRSEIVATTLDYNYVRRYNSTGYSLSSGSHFHHNGLQVNSLQEPVLLANRLTASGLFWHEQHNIGLERNEYDVYISPNDQRSRQIARQIDALGDFLHVAPLVRQLELHANSVGQVYMFVFDYKGARSFGHLQLNPYGRSMGLNGETQTNGWLPSAPSSTGALLSSESSNFGVTHNDDLFYLLPNDFAPPSSLEGARPGSAGATLQQQLVVGAALAGAGPSLVDGSNDDNVIRNYCTYLAAFVARVGDARASANNLANWLPFRQTDRNYLRFSEQLPTLYKNFHQLDVAFVNELVEPIEELVNTPLPLFPYEELRDFKVSTAALGLMLLLVVLTLLLVACLLACRRRRRRRQQTATLALHTPVLPMHHSGPAAPAKQRPSGHQSAIVQAKPEPSAAADRKQQQQQQAKLNEQTIAELEGRLSRLSQRFESDARN